MSSRAEQSPGTSQPYSGEDTSSIGSFVLMLHSHLPWYRKSGMWPFGEENLYECIAETYIPLLNVIADLYEEGVLAKLTIGFTPILQEQLADEYLKLGFERYIDSRIEAAMSDSARFAASAESPNLSLSMLSRSYLSCFKQIKADFRNRWNRDILGGYKQMQELGAIEITTSAATHCFSPLLNTDSSLFAQYEIGVATYKKHFGRQPQGFWLPECAYRPATDERPGLEKWMHQVGIQYFFVESTAIAGGQTAIGPYCSNKSASVNSRPSTGLNTFQAFLLKEYPIAVMARHEHAACQVWSTNDGYPGDGNYREFHKKDDTSGLHYWRLTSKSTRLGDKQYYNPEAATAQLQKHSEHYVGLIQHALTEHFKQTSKTGLVMVSFDTELFGHWWFEGIAWLKEIIRKFHSYTAVALCTASEYLQAYPPAHTISLPESSWGAGGHWHVWLNDETEWMWPVINRCEKQMEHLARKYGEEAGHLTKRILKQAARELLLIEASDWPFLITTGQAKIYAINRFKEHVDRFDCLIGMLNSSNIDEGRLHDIEDIDKCFQSLPVSDFILPPETFQKQEQ